jgi:putative addiction module component (TIGR02574 family)
MKRAAANVLREALSLPETDRAEIAGALLESLEPPPDADIEEAWRLEVAERMAALDNGRVEPILWAEVRDRLLARLSERRPG